MMLSLIIPCYNEALNIAALLEQCAKAFAHRNDCEVILVDNGSRDNTPGVLAELLPRYPFVRTVRVDVNQGYGFGILTGLKATKGQWLGWTHADLQTDPGDALMVLDRVIQTQHAPIFYKGQRYGRRIYDLFFTIGMSLFDSLLLGVGLWDINAQPTIFSRSFFDSWQSPPHDFALDLYAYYLAKKQKLPIQRFPVFFGKRMAGIAHLHNIQAKLRFTKRTILYTLALRKSDIR